MKVRHILCLFVPGPKNLVMLLIEAWMGNPCMKVRHFLCLVVPGPKNLVILLIKAWMVEVPGLARTTPYGTHTH